MYSGRSPFEVAREQVKGFYGARTIEALLEPEQRFGLVSFVSGDYFRLPLVAGATAVQRAPRHGQYMS